MTINWLLSCVFLYLCALFVVSADEFIAGPGGMRLHPSCHVELPEGATVINQEKIILADGTEIPYPPCTYRDTNNTEVNNKRAADVEKRIANGWNLYSVYYGGYVINQFDGDWVVPANPGMGYTGQLIYMFTGLEPTSDDPILQPVIWYGISPAGGGNNWFAAVWEVHSNSAYTTSQVVQVYPGQVIHTTMFRSKGSAWTGQMFANGQYITGAAFADREYVFGFTSLELYGVADCNALPYLTTTSFYNMGIVQDNVGPVAFVNANWRTYVTSSECNQAITCAGNVCNLQYGIPALSSPLVFDMNAYRAFNGDLPWSDFGNLYNHWVNNGINEGRRASYSFWVNEYKQTYGDLAPLSNWDAVNHYAYNGYNEGRAGLLITNPLVFDWVWYLQNNGDLLAAFGYNRFSALNHFAANGIYEGRQANSFFAVQQYLAMYPDLQAAFGANNFYRAAQHWVTNGYAEGRRGRN